MRELNISIKPKYQPVIDEMGWQPIFDYCDAVDARDGDVQVELEVMLDRELERIASKRRR